MKAPCIRLPDERLLEPIAIAQAIVDAYFPLHEFSYGMDCVLSIRDKRAGKLPFAITQQQKDVLVELLPKLPSLHGRMLDSEVREFVLAFERLAPHLPWTPSIVDDHARKTRRERRDHYTKKHLADLKRSVAESQLIAVDENHIRCAILGVGAFIPQNEAFKYLESNGHTVEFNASTNIVENNFVLDSPNTEIIDAETSSAPKYCPTDESRQDSAPIAPTAQKPMTDENTSENEVHSANKSSPPTEIESISTETEADRFIALDEVMTLIGAKKTTVYGMMDENSSVFDPTFPRILPKRPGSSASRWSRNEILAWQDRQKNQRK